MAIAEVALALLRRWEAGLAVAAGTYWTLVRTRVCFFMPVEVARALEQPVAYWADDATDGSSIARDSGRSHCAAFWA